MGSGGGEKLGFDNRGAGLLVVQNFFPDRKLGVCPTPADATREMSEKLDIASAPVQEMIRDLVAHHVAVTSTLPVFESGGVPNRPPLDSRVLDSMLPEARIAYLQRRAAVSEGAAKSPWTALFQT